MNEDYSKKILSLIHEENIEPDPSWRYLLRKYARWSLVGLFVMLASAVLAAGVAFFLDVDWRAVSLSREHSLFDVFQGISLFWLTLLALLLPLTMYGMRKTERGYRWGSGAIFGTGVLLVAAFGIIFVFFRIGETIERETGNRFPSYESREDRDERLWSRPNQGLLGGSVVSVSDVAVLITDFSGSAWQVSISPETVVDSSVTFRPKEELKIVGVKSSDSDFSAKEVSAWHKKSSKESKSNDAMSGEDRDE